jgi:hypothetical protein
MPVKKSQQARSSRAKTCVGVAKAAVVPKQVHAQSAVAAAKSLRWSAMRDDEVLAV